MAPRFPDFPLEIWLQIFDTACNDNGTTARSLSLTSRALQSASRCHRYHSVSITGWAQLLAFEATYSKVPHELRNNVNLYVHLPELYSVAYPPDSWCDEGAGSDDSSYVPSEVDTEDNVEWDDGDDLVGFGLGDAEDNDSEEGSDSEYGGGSEWDDISDISYSSSKDSEWYEDDANMDYRIVSDHDFDYGSIPHEKLHGQDLSYLEGTPRAICQLEYRVFSALRRVLEASAHSLKIFTLCWQPSSSFYLEAVFPILPRLNSLSIFKDVIPLERASPVQYKFHLEREKVAPALFPALERLNFNGLHSKSWDENAFKGLLTAPLRFITAPQFMIESLVPLPDTVEEIRIRPTSASGYHSRDYSEDEIMAFYGNNLQYRSRTAVYRRVGPEEWLNGPSDFETHWLQQLGCEVPNGGLAGPA